MLVRPGPWAVRDAYGLCMPIVAARESYYETGLAILADLGYGGLKLAEVCSRLGVTTGSFYHYFSGWGAYTRELLGYWRQDRTVRLIEVLRSQPDAPRRIQAIIDVALALPHSAEAAIRAWSSVAPDVLAVQREVDQERFDILYESALEIVGDERQAQTYAAWSVYVFVGYEQATLPREATLFAWMSKTMLQDLQAGRFADVPAP
jgi:AcrR family transcriptional regulator